MKTFKEGDKVWLPANKEEGWVDEIGTVIDVQKKKKEIIYGIQLDAKYYNSKIDDGIRETSEVKPVSKFNKLKTKNKTIMAKNAKKSIKKAAKKSVNRPAAKSVKAEGMLTRGQAAEKLKISIYAVDQLLNKKQLKSLTEVDVVKYKKTAKA
jgi:hypothetical protein